MSILSLMTDESRHSKFNSFELFIGALVIQTL